MKKHLLFLFCVCLQIVATSQSFTKITSGNFVNDGASSFAASWGDSDNDNYQDLFVGGVYSENDLFYKNNGNGIFTQITSGPLVTDSTTSEAATWGDYDNDGDLDLFVAIYNGNNRLYRNNGNGTFSQVTSGSIVNDLGNSIGAAWGDYDNDGFLDLFVANHDENNFLYHNNGDGSFTKITSEIIVTDGGWSNGCAWVDYDNDGFIDLFVSNNFQGNDFLYYNNGNGTFTKITNDPVVSDSEYTHGGSWADYDNDGDLDLFVTAGIAGSTPFNKNNLLYQNNGDGTFTKITTGALVTELNTSTGAAWGDYDNDGNVDLFVSNSSANAQTIQTNFLYKNNGDGTFTKLTNEPMATETNTYSRGAAWADSDNDGDLDLFVANEYYTHNFFYQNNGNNNNWINIKCEGLNNNNRSAIGARVYVKTTDNVGGTTKWQMQEISSQTGYMGQNSLNVEFGLGNATIIDSVKVRWTSGLICHYTNVPVNQFLYTTDNCELVGITEKEKMNNESSINIFPNPNDGVFNVQISKSEKVRMEIFNLLGEIVYEQKITSNQQPVRTFLPSGIYFVKISSNGKEETKKLIVAKE